MTKIDQISPGQAGQPEPARKPERGGGDFARLLDEALGRQDAGPGAASAPLSGPAQPLGGVVAGGEVGTPAAPEGLTPLQNEGVARAERTLALLEQYARQLGDGRVSLKELEPSLTALEEEARGLAEVADRLDPADELHGIVQEVLMRVAAESVKFNRGDYLSA